MTKSNTSRILNEFCESKVCWTFVILAATCLGVVFLANQTQEYLDGTILTTIESSSAPLDVSIDIDPI